MFSQIDSRVAFFRAMNASSANLVTITNAQATMASPVVTTNGTAYIAGNVLRDMGKSVTVVNADGLATHRYRSARVVNGEKSEGVRAADVSAVTEYVLVWAASGSGVNVVRLG